MRIITLAVYGAVVIRNHQSVATASGVGKGTRALMRFNAKRTPSPSAAFSMVLILPHAPDPNMSTSGIATQVK